jgi:hypothetical protein
VAARAPLVISWSGAVSRVTAMGASDLPTKRIVKVSRFGVDAFKDHSIGGGGPLLCNSEAANPAQRGEDSGTEKRISWCTQRTTWACGKTT